MTTPLQRLFQAIAQVQNEAELREPIIAKMGDYFVAKRRRLFLLDRLPGIDKNTPDTIKLALSLDYNPVLRYLFKRHVAVHDEVVLPPGVWQRICPRADHGHVMVGPIVSNGQLVGGIAFTRYRNETAFTAENLADLSALCLHISIRLVELHSNSMIYGLNYDIPGRHAQSERLTPREVQIAELVAEGLTNKEIGENLWITENSVKQALKRMFRKLEVSSRAEMVTKLFVSTASISQKSTAV